jgi:hypothetical protein
MRTATRLQQHSTGQSMTASGIFTGGGGGCHLYTTYTSCGSSKLRSGSASMQSRTNQSTRPNVTFGYWNAPLVLEPPRVSKWRSSHMTWATCSIRQVQVRCALLLSLTQNSARQPIKRDPTVRLTLTISTTTCEVAHAAHSWS